MTWMYPKIVLAILSTTAIVIVGFAAKAYYILRNDWNRGHSLLEVKPLPPPLKKKVSHFRGDHRCDFVIGRKLGRFDLLVSPCGVCLDGCLIVVKG